MLIKHIPTFKVNYKFTSDRYYCVFCFFVPNGMLLVRGAVEYSGGAQTLASDRVDSNPVLPLTAHVTWDQLLNLSATNTDKNST